MKVTEEEDSKDDGGISVIVKSKVTRVSLRSCLARLFTCRAAAFDIFFILNEYFLVFLDHFDVLISKIIFKN